MGRIFPLLLIIYLLSNGSFCLAQTSVRVSDPRLEMRDHILHISYDLLNSNPNDKYIISIEIQDEHGNAIQANALQGDIGEIEDGGMDKHIAWDLNVDNVLISGFIYVKVNAKAIPRLKPVITEPEEKVDENLHEDQINKEDQALIDESKDSETEYNKEMIETPPASDAVEFNRTSIILQSIAMPGLGLTRVTGNPHWIKGIAGYGCIAGAVALNLKAANTFDEIENLDLTPDMESTFNESVRLDMISEILAYAAAGIWIIDIIWTYIGTSDLAKSPRFSYTKGFSIGSNVDPLSNTPLVSVVYRF